MSIYWNTPTGFGPVGVFDTFSRWAVFSGVPYGREEFSLRFAEQSRDIEKFSDFARSGTAPKTDQLGFGMTSLAAFVLSKRFGRSQAASIAEARPPSATAASALLRAARRLAPPFPILPSGGRIRR